MSIDEATDDEADTRLFGQVMELWVRPEVVRRVAEGRLTAPIELRAVQVLFSPGSDDPPVVRINDEVKGLLTARAARAISEGQAVLESDMSEMIDLNLLEPEEDCGHVTMLRHGGTWFIKFDFLYNKKRARAYRSAGAEFLRSAQDALARGDHRAFVENLLHAGELGGRSSLSMHPGNPVFRGEVQKRNSHEFIPSLLERHEGHVQKEDRLARALRELNELRRAGSYMDADFVLDARAAKTMLDLIARRCGYSDE